MPSDENDKKYDTVKLPATIASILNCNENVCIKVCKRPKSDTDTNPPLECSLMCLVKATEPQPWQWNPLRNYALSVKNTDANKSESDYQVNLGDQLDRIGRKAGHVAQVSYDASKGYIDSWKDGSQAAFFRRVYELSTDKEQLQALREHAKKTVDIFWNGDGKKKKKDNEQDDQNDKDNKDNKD